jgi:uncharacterized protein (UPF0276 family)
MMLPAQSKRARPGHLVVPDLGVGAGLRAPHYAAILEQTPEIGFFEAISENYFGGGRPRYHLERVAERYPLVLHGVALGIGGPMEPDRGHLTRLRDLARQVRAPWVSDHLCWTSAGGAHLHDLLPLPLTGAVAKRIARRARMIQDFLELPFALENTSSYVTFAQSEMSEWEFIAEVCKVADCGLLLDVNNIYVSAFNHDYEPLQFLQAVPHERVLQIHVAGHTHFGTHIIDTHVGPTPPPVLELYREAIRLCGPVSTLLEWDEDIPALNVILSEVERLSAERQRGLESKGTPGEQPS